MKNKSLICACLVAFAFCFSGPGIHAESELLSCGKAEAWLAAGVESAEFLKYAPSRKMDVLHLALDVTPDFKARTVAGKATLRLKPIAKPLAELKLDGVDLLVSDVTSTERVLGWQATDKHVIVTFAEAIAPDKEASVTIAYQATPQKGLYFRTPEMGYPAMDSHLWTQGEPLEARHWFPSFDAPNEKFTSEVTCRVPEGMVVISNGKKMSEAKDAATGLVAVRWLQDKPHVNYLIALCAGYFKKVEGKHRDLPMAFWTPASQIAQAQNSFRDTKDMMEFFEKEIGVNYPWAKYDQVCVEDFGWGGMENTTITILNDRTLFTDATENLRDSTGLVAHELAHQWFGDYVTCKDWSHLWLNEGFATYYEALYAGHQHGRDMFLYRMLQNAKGILAQASDTNAIVRRDFNHPEDQFGFHAYPKGAWVLHMLRSQLGEDLFRRCVKTYLERHAFGNVTTDDLLKVIEELSGRSFDQFFNQYVYHAHHPELNVSYSWDERTKLAKLSVQQVQKLSDDVLLFNVSLPVRFKGKSGAVTERTLDVKEKVEDFYIPLTEAPEIVRLDPNLTLLAKVAFNPPTAMLHAQLADKNDMLGRLFAVEQLSGRKDALGRLKDALNNDSFHGIRLAAAQSIRAMQTDEALDSLIASTKQPDARVRRDVVSAIGGFYRETSYTALTRIIKEEKNPDIQATALTALGSYTKPEVRDEILKALGSTSYRHGLADAAINAIRAQADASYIAPLLDMLQTKEAAFTTGGFANGLSTLAFLSRNEERKDAAREFLLGRLNSPKRRVQLAAINALGGLGDARALAALETFTTTSKESPERAAAERAVASLRDTRKPSVEVGAVRNDLLTLQRENRDLRKELDDLKKKVEALSAKPAEAKPAAAKSTPPAKPAVAPKHTK
jgi:aminopeptidase N